MVPLYLYFFIKDIYILYYRVPVFCLVEATIMISIIEHTEQNTDLSEFSNKDRYRVDLFFLKRGNILLVQDVDGVSLPHSISTWSSSPEDVACECARRLGIVIHQFDYPLGFSSFPCEGIDITSYALVPSMWKEESILGSALWVTPARLPHDIVPHARDVICKYFCRVEKELIYGSFVD